MDEEKNVTNTDQPEAENKGGQEGAEQPGKTFTQKEVDDIVEKRLRRERKKFTGLLNGEDPRELELAEREKAVAIKEAQIEMRGLLDSKKLPVEALELLDYTDKKSCEKSVELLEKIVKDAVETRISEVLRGGSPPRRSVVSGMDDVAGSVRSAFGL